MNVHLGSMHAASFASDPKHLGFVLRRYHFVARMLRGSDFVLEIGCGDGSAAGIVRKAVGALVGIDANPSITCAPGEDYQVSNILDGPLTGFGVPFTGIYALDVLEHIDPMHEDRFFQNINASLAEHGTVIIGSPSLESQPYASELSKQHHVNCKTGEQFNDTLRRHYHNVFLLGLNDYALHDGFDALVHYRLGICTGKR